MYVKNSITDKHHDAFDWDKYFSQKYKDEILEQMDYKKIVLNLRSHLQENKFKMAFTLGRVLRVLLKDLNINKNPGILELGAATGFLTRWLISQYGGTGVLVDKSKASYNAYTLVKDNIKKYITYLNKDFFTLELAGTFDLICSFGLIEHFLDKSAVLAVHKKFLASNGFIIILVPMDSPLTRSFLEVHLELNLGYRELLTEKSLKCLLMQNGMEVIKTQISKGYVYDFVGAVCRISKSESIKDDFIYGN
jgi:SAM-dependent methyltransferase